MNSITKDFNGLPIVFREDGYISATKASRQFGKRDARKFFENKETQEYLEVLSNLTQIPVNILRPSTKGRNGGTYLHPKVAIRFARWLSVEFEVWCDLMIDNILKGNIQTSVVVPTQEAIDVNAVVAPFKARIMELEGEVQRLQESGLADGEVPKGWMSQWNFLEDQGHQIPFIRAASADFGTLCSSEHKKMHLAVVTIKGRVGSREKDTSYYQPDALKAAYLRLLKMYELNI